MTKYQQGFPVNENGEVVTANGSGTRTIVGTLPASEKHPALMVKPILMHY